MQRFIILVLIYLIGYGQGLSAQPLENIEISLLTCGQGDQLYSTFGHSAIRVQDRSRSYDVVYNYGTFDTTTPGFYLKFMRGKLPYFVSQASMNAFLREYQYYKRSVIEQKIILSEEQKYFLLSLLQQNALPENKFYPYDFFYDNCSTRIRDIVQKGKRDKVVWPENTEQLTRREQLWEFLTGKPWSEFGIDLVIGAKADRPVGIEGQMFLPIYLSDHFAGATAEDTLLVSPPITILDYAEIQESREQIPFFTPHILFLILLVFEGILFLKYRRSSFPKWVNIYHKLIFLTVGIGSLIMIFLWFFTDHQACAINWNLIWASPLFLVYPFVKSSLMKLILRIILIVGIAIAMVNTLMPFLPQVFSQYNLGLYALLLLSLWMDNFPQRRKALDVRV